MTVSALRLQKALATDSTAAAFTAKIPTATEPSGVGVFRLSDSSNGLGVDGKSPSHVLLIPYGGNDNNDVMNVRLWGWSRTGLAATPVYVPQLLAELAVTLGNVDASAVGASLFLADTIAVTYGDTNEKTLGVSVSSPANDVPANALVHLRGVEYIEFDFKLGAGGDKMNCYWRGMDINK